MHYLTNKYVFKFTMFLICMLKISCFDTNAVCGITALRKRCRKYSINIRKSVCFGCIDMPSLNFCKILFYIERISDSFQRLI
jgi:hypothetical protein